jgi:hypothetical protein
VGRRSFHLHQNKHSQTAINISNINTVQHSISKKSDYDTNNRAQLP